ncbi:hypothetical protein TorRG33x02_256570, partial [Trema orientale]
ESGVSMLKNKNEENGQTKSGELHKDSKRAATNKRRRENYVLQKKERDMCMNVVFNHVEGAFKETKYVKNCRRKLTSTEKEGENSTIKRCKQISNRGIIINEGGVLSESVIKRNNEIINHGLVINENIVGMYSVGGNMFGLSF